MAGFDLAALDTQKACETPFEFEIVHPVTGAATGIFWSVRGKDSPAYRQKVRDFADQSLRGKQQAQSLDQIEAKNVDALVAASTGWRSDEHGAGKIMMDGDVLEFNAANARAVLLRLEPVRDQVQAQVNDLGNFMKG